MLARYELPQFVQRGLLTTLGIDIFDDDGTHQDASAAFVTVKAGSRTIIDNDSVNITLLGEITATIPLTAAQSVDESLSDRWIGIWTLTIGGVVQPDFVRPIYLVRRVLQPVITDTDLEELHTDLQAIRPSNLQTYERYRVAAFTLLEKELIRAGRRPQLVIDAWALRDIHRYWTLELIFRDFSTSMQEGSQYRELAAEYRSLRQDEFSQSEFRYDFDEDGNIDDGRQQAAAGPVLYLSSAPAWR